MGTVTELPRVRQGNPTLIEMARTARDALRQGDAAQALALLDELHELWDTAQELNMFLNLLDAITADKDACVGEAQASLGLMFSCLSVAHDSWATYKEWYRRAAYAHRQERKMAARVDREVEQLAIDSPADLMRAHPVLRSLARWRLAAGL